MGMNTRIPKLRRFVLQNFPFIEQDFDALTDYALICKVVEYLNKVIAQVNADTAAYNQLAAAFADLESYVEHYFDNLDVQDEINHKIDQMVEDGSLTALIKDYIDPIQEAYEDQVNAKIEEQDNKIESIETLVSGAVSGSPAGVYATAADLTTADPDHSKIYVVTADGKWYYYDTNNSSWVAGGTYQSTAIGEKTLTPYLLDEQLRNATFKSYNSNNLCKQNNDVVKLKVANATTITANDNYRAIVIPITGGKTYKCGHINTDGSNAIRICTTADYPNTSSTVIDFVSNNVNDTLQNERFYCIETSETANYLLFYFGEVGQDITNYATLLNSLSCYELDNYTPQISYGEYNSSETSNVLLKTKQAIYNTLGSEDLFNPYDKTKWANVIPASGGGTTYALIGSYISIIWPIGNGETYTVKKEVASDRFRISFANVYPIANYTTFYDSTNHDSDNAFTFTNSDNYKYAVIQIKSSSYATHSWEEILSGIHIYKTSSVIDPETKFDNLLSNKYIELVKERKLGTLEKGYIALSADDGNMALVNHTIPILEDLGANLDMEIPITLGLMSSSAIFSDNSAVQTVSSYLTNNHGSVAIHGSTDYTQYSQSELYNFLDQQKEYLTTNLKAPSSIIYPEHTYNTLTATIAGSYYGVCGTGGVMRPITYGPSDVQPSCNGPRSNQYTLYRYSLFNVNSTNDSIKAAIDYAYDNHMIFMPFFHDTKLDSDDAARCEGLLRYCVTYAKSKGLTFINIGDIPTIK